MRELGSSHPGLSLKSRFGCSGPILLVAVIFILASFLSWYFTWFGRGLSDAEISTYLKDEKHPRHVQHALFQIQERLENKNAAARQWYPDIISLANSSQPEFRLTVAWLMGSDNQSNDFHRTLLKLVHDEEPMVRRNAALALLRFADTSGHSELLAVLQPYTVVATARGVVASTLARESKVSRGTLVSRLLDQTTIEIRSPLPGKVEKVVAANGARVEPGEPLMTISSDEKSMWEALRGLALIGEPADLTIINPYVSNNGVSERVREQATLTVKAIEQRHTSG